MKALFTLALLALAFTAGAQTPPATRNAQPTSLSKVQPKTVPVKHDLNLRIRVKGYTTGDAILANYYGDKQYITDSAKIDANGNMVFRSTEKHVSGMYIVQFAEYKKYIEVILLEGEMNFSIETDTADLVGNMKITGSKENQQFLEHNLFLAKKMKVMEKLQADFKQATTAKDADKEKKLREEITALDTEVKTYKRNYYNQKYPNSFFAKVLQAMDEPDLLPYEQCPRKADGTIDSAYNNRNYRQHYWDGFDFSDGRLSHTPVFHNKMKFFLEKIISPAPDSIIVAANWLIEKCSNDSDLFKYALFYCTYTYEVSKIMGYDAIFVNLVENYHMKNRVWWLSKEQLTKVNDRARKLKFSLIGATAVNVVLPDSSGIPRQLQYANADYTIVIFWEPTCSHCKHDIPLLKTYYDSLRTAGISVEVYAINSEHDPAAWTKFIRDNKLTWINVMSKDPQLLANYKYYYDVYSTPTVYILDKQKKIFAKRLDVEGMRKFLNRRIDDDRKKAKSTTPK